MVKKEGITKVSIKVEVEKEVWKEFKVYAVRAERGISELIGEYITNTVKGEKKVKKEKKEKKEESKEVAK